MKLVGTNQGGGGGTSIVWGKLRGDAELVKQWTYNKLIHADEGVTIPAYSTNAKTLRTGAALSETASLNFGSYSYMMLIRCLVIPIYSDSSKGNGRQFYYAHSGFMPMTFIPKEAFDYDGESGEVGSTSAQFDTPSQSSFRRLVYYSNSHVRFVSSQYGAYVSASAPSVSVSGTYPYNTGTLTVTEPNFYIRGSSSYLNSTNWGKLTDIRYQYIYELYRVPATDTVHGWEVESQFRHVLDCANGNGTLT